MGEAIGQLLPFAVGVAVSPMPIVAVILMLVTPKARSNGPAFLLGWLVGVGLGGAVLLALAGPTNASDDGAPPTGFPG
jgi:Sap, sulfolipid-1-addressing protein